MTAAQNSRATEFSQAQEGPGSTLSFLPAGSSVATLIRSIDWSKTALGAADDWPQSLRTSVGICLNSRFPMLIWWGPQLVKIYNDAYIPMLGAKHPRALGLPGRDVWPEIWHIIGPMLDGVMQRGQATWSEDTMLPLQRKGFVEECYFTFSYSPINVESGEIGGVFTAVSETSAKVIGERRLDTLRQLGNLGSGARTAAQAAALAARVLSSNPKDVPFCLVYLAAPDGTLELRGMAGFEPGECGAPPQIRLAATGSAVVALLRNALESGQLVEIDEPLALTGTVPQATWPEVPSRAAALRVSVSQDDHVGMLVVGISPRLSLDDNYRAFLTLVAGQLGGAISAANAYEAERGRAEALAEVDRAKTTFFANVSHEFRTPITLMLGPLEDALADPRPETDRNRERVKIAHRNALRLQKLVNTLLEFSRIEAGRASASYRPTNLARLTAELASVFRASIETAGLRYSVRISELSEAAYIDREMWEKIVLNLLSNAFKFTVEGEIDVCLTESAGAALLTVRDTGTGIPASELPHLFQRFHRVAGTVGRTQDGSGIGLALIQELVRLHGGAIAVGSELGKGTAFEVRIPLGRNHLPHECILDEAPPSTPSSYATASVAEAQGWHPHAEASGLAALPIPGRPRILLADDNADMRAYISSLVADAWDVVAVSNGEEALAAATLHPPDLVLSDVMMPKLDGLALIERLRQNDRTKQVPVLLLSARCGEESRIEGLRAGADDYLVKPFSAKELLARIQTHLQIGRFKAAAERERAKLSAVFAQAPVGIALLEGPEHVFAIANPVYYSLLFGGARDFVGKAVRDAIPEAVSQGFVAILDRVYRTGEPFVGNEMPIDLVQKDGALRRFYLNFVYQPLRDANEHVHGIVAVIHDVTERVVCRVAIEDSERKYRTLAESLTFERNQLETIFQRSPAAMALWVGPDLVFERVNPHYQAIFPDRQLLGRPLLEACPEFRDQPFPGLLRHVLESGEDHVGREVLARHGDSADGPPVDHYYDFSYLRINDSEGNPYGVYDHAIDVSDRVHDRRALEENKQRLEKVVADLEQERDLRERFVSMLSHDLRSPLQAATMCAHLIRRKVCDSEVAQTFAARIIGNIGRADEMIRNLLDASRLKAGERLAIEKIEHCELKEVVADTLADLTTLHGDRFLLKADSTIDGYWSKGEIRRVLENLCGNAVKYGAPYRPVRVTLLQLDDSITIEVQNEGNPIPAADLEQLFQPFKRIAGPTGGAAGWGLGLTLVKGIVEAHGGRVSVQSDSAVGTAFSITLPLDSRGVGQTPSFDQHARQTSSFMTGRDSADAAVSRHIPGDPSAG